MSDEVEKVIASLRALDFQLSGVSGDHACILDASEILYSQEKLNGNSQNAP